jgi:hypothetical protein
MKILSAAKAMLVKRTLGFYSDMRENLSLDASEYKDHFSNMGELLLKIDTYESFGDICKDLEKGEFAEIGYFWDDADMMEEFLENLQKYLSK